uniref:Putative serine/threonine kinase n=1 Tax=Culex tarsalis TaxID=7177 RepID=A0A1Q3F6X2_CULTA
MLCASSQHIVRLHAVHETRSETALILELATGGELQTIIDNKGQLSEEKARTCMREVLRALNHLHKQSIIHLDLKPQNILLSGNDVEDGLKLCDFGIARIVGDTGKIMEILGTPDYVAPEVLQYEPLSLRTDIWSIGVLTYVLLTGYSPFGGDNKQETSLNITKCLLDFPDYLFENVSEDAIDFIKCALRIKPKERPTVDECLEHRWLKEEDGTNKPKDPLVTAATTITATKQLPQEEDEPSCPLIIENVPLLRTSNGHYNGHSNGTTVELPEEAKSKVPQSEEDESDETNKENVLQVQNGGATTVTVPQQANVVEIVTVSLFPDAPTTPKVSRKAPPSEQQQNGQLNHGSHTNHHHSHHHHHHLNHHHHSSTTTATSRYHHATNNNNSTVSSRQSSTCGSTPSPHSVKAYVQKFQQQQQQQESTTAATVMLPMENGFCAAAAATLCCLKCSEETIGGGPASAAGLAVAVATVASRKTLQCGDKGIIC